MRIFGPCRSAMIADFAARALRAISRTSSRALDVVGGGAVREIEAHDVHAGGEHALPGSPASLQAGPSVATILVVRGMVESV